MLAGVEELLARDLVVPVDRVEPDLFEREALAAGLAGDVQREVDGELPAGLAVAAEERALHRLAVEVVDGGPALGLLDYRRPADRLLAVPFDRDDVRRVHRPHDLEVLALPAHLHKLRRGGLKAHRVISIRKERLVRADPIRSGASNALDESGNVAGRSRPHPPTR